MLALILIQDRPRLGRVALAMATALALSTLTTKQHFLADVVSGYGLAFFGRWFALRRLPAT
jgi:membrane-associated phospholipid phosphatase